MFYRYPDKIIFTYYMVTFPPEHNTYPNGRPTGGSNFQRAISRSRDSRGLGPRRRRQVPVIPVINYERSKKNLTNARNRAIILEKAAYGKRLRNMHVGGLVRKTSPHRLLKGEIVLSRSQCRGLTHGQILKILDAYRRR